MDRMLLIHVKLITYCADVIWPKDWIIQVLPATKTDKWCYDIIEKEEPLPVDDALDPRYEGSTVIQITNVPKTVSSPAYLNLRYI